LGQEKHPLFLIAGGSRQRVYADGLVVALEVAFDEVAIFEGVLDRVAMVVAWQLDYFVKADRVGLASLLLMDSVNHRDKLIVMMPLVVLLAFTPMSVVPSLVHGLNLRLAIVFAKVAQTASSLEAWLVARSSSSRIIQGLLPPSSWTRALLVVLEMNALIMSTSMMLGS
jgi:hypothetical protein